MPWITCVICIQNIQFYEDKMHQFIYECLDWYQEMAISYLYILFLGPYFNTQNMVSSETDVYFMKNTD